MPTSLDEYFLNDYFDRLNLLSYMAVYFTQFLSMAIFRNKYFTWLRCGVIFNDHFSVNLQTSLAVKELLKTVRPGSNSAKNVKSYIPTVISQDFPRPILVGSFHLSEMIRRDPGTGLSDGDPHNIPIPAGSKTSVWNCMHWLCRWKYGSKTSAARWSDCSSALAMRWRHMAPLTAACLATTISSSSRALLWRPLSRRRAAMSERKTTRLLQHISSTDVTEQDPRSIVASVKVIFHGRWRR